MLQKLRPSRSKSHLHDWRFENEWRLSVFLSQSGCFYFIFKVILISFLKITNFKIKKLVKPKGIWFYSQFLEGVNSTDFTNTFIDDEMIEKMTELLVYKNEKTATNIK